MELNKKHKYIGRYPCEKRRRLRGVNESSLDHMCEQQQIDRRLQRIEEENLVEVDNIREFFETLEKEQDSLVFHRQGDE